MDYFAESQTSGDSVYARLLVDDVVSSYFPDPNIGVAVQRANNFLQYDMPPVLSAAGSRSIKMQLRTLTGSRTIFNRTMVLKTSLK